MIESGSHTPGVDPADFRLPDGTALRYERSAPALEGLVGDYFMLDSQEPAEYVSEWMLPNWPVIRFVLADNPLVVEGDGWRWEPMLEAGFYGPTTRASRMLTKGGVTIGVSPTPAGVARMFDIDLARYRNRMVPLGSLIGQETCVALVESLRASDRGIAVKPILDAFFAATMSVPHPAEAQIARLNALLLDEDIRTVDELAEAMDLPIHGLRRLALRRFGFPPKVLMIRARFLRSLIALKAVGATQGYRAIDDAYTDTSHFLRDSQRFLGMTAQRFLRLPTPYLDAMLRARAIVIGQPIPTLATNPLPPAEKAA
ncbi:hypothetical protein [Pelagerythrobacter sp.]|uniref:hypothetical protein n=1 Tax=Pelagerythrobacter sp. TaxID=2800702 RepID=UPI0035B15C08